jgi:hypothetical protein
VTSLKWRKIVPELVVRPDLLSGYKFQDVRVCLIHQHPLVQNCPYCHRRLLWLEWQSSLGYCSEYSHWLGGSSNTPVVTQNRWIAESFYPISRKAQKNRSM